MNRPPVECPTCGGEIPGLDAEIHLRECSIAKYNAQRKEYYKGSLQTQAGKIYAGDKGHASKWRVKGPKYPVVVKKRG